MMFIPTMSWGVMLNSQLRLFTWMLNMGMGRFVNIIPSLSTDMCYLELVTQRAWHCLWYFAAWYKFGTFKNGCRCLDSQACEVVPKAKAANCVSHKQLWYDNCCTQGELNLWYALTFIHIDWALPTKGNYDNHHDLNFRKLGQKVVKSKCILRNYWRATLHYSW